MIVGHYHAKRKHETPNPRKTRVSAFSGERQSVPNVGTGDRSKKAGSWRVPGRSTNRIRLPDF
jgi:hypothetical protein